MRTELAVKKRASGNANHVLGLPSIYTHRLVYVSLLMPNGYNGVICMALPRSEGDLLQFGVD